MPSNGVALAGGVGTSWEAWGRCNKRILFWHKPHLINEKHIRQESQTGLAALLNCLHAAPAGTGGCSRTTHQHRAGESLRRWRQENE